VEKEMKTLSLEEIKSYQGDKSIINSFLIRLLPPENYTNFTISDINKKVELENYLKEYLLNKYKSKEREVGIEQMRSLERYILLNVMDYHWREHLRDMDDLRDGIGLHAYAQRDPLIEYQHESYSMFEQMIDEMKEYVLRVLFHAKKVEGEEEDREASKERILIKNKKVKTKRIATKYKKIGRNDPCPCGSGKKYKLCCDS
ncbi:unnamed protein product, partial [marine sediment metagenome]